MRENPASSPAAARPRTAPRLPGALAALLCALALPAAAADRFTLISPEEHARALAEPAAGAALEAKGGVGAPAIVVREPGSATDGLSSPVDIELGFEALGDATVDMGSLRIYYVLLFKKDVTERILEHAEVGADYIRAEGAELPSGRHAFLVEIVDSEGRKSSRKFEITVEG